MDFKSFNQQPFPAAFSSSSPILVCLFRKKVDSHHNICKELSEFLRFVISKNWSSNYLGSCSKEENFLRKTEYVMIF